MNLTAERSLICIICPKGCRITAVRDATHPLGYRTIGNICQRGEEYAIDEIIHPVRMLTTTIATRNLRLPRLPVRTREPIPKHLLSDGLALLAGLEIDHPVQMGEIIIPDLLGSGVDVIASRSLD